MPPFTDLRSVQTLVDGDRLEIRYGAQDVSTHDGGAYTGEISAAMLAKLGCSYVVVGHSERREHHAESDATVNAKADKAIAAKHDADRLRRRGARGPQGGPATSSTRWRRSTARWPGSPPSRSARWWSPTSPSGPSAPARWPPPTTRRRSAPRSARGSPRPGPSDAARAVRILYGGSVKAANIAGIMEKTDVDGALVGGASLQPDEFGGICRFYDMPVI